MDAKVMEARRKETPYLILLFLPTRSQWLQLADRGVEFRRNKMKEAEVCLHGVPVFSVLLLNPNRVIEVLPVLDAAEDLSLLVLLECHLPTLCNHFFCGPLSVLSGEGEIREYRIVLREKRRRKNNQVKCVKWLGALMDESLSFREHWRARIKKARNLLGKCNGIGNSVGDQCKKLEESVHRNDQDGGTMGGRIRMERATGLGERIREPPISSTSKVQGVRGSRKELVNQIAGVESPRMAIEASHARLAIKTMRNHKTLGGTNFEDNEV
ncbi:hypothetical protein BGX38DRAFT_1277154 [Terfezia claveryi]|nr:hypothetical protein BGX38DRAFT_1277154 [Terfezia claveryi]